MVGIGALAGAYYLLKNKNAVTAAVAMPTGAKTVLPTNVSADWNPTIYYTELPVQDPFYNAHPSLHDSAPVDASVIASSNSNCVSVTFSATNGGGYAKWLDCQGYPREQYLASTQTLKVCAMNGTPSGIPYLVNGQC